jgi:hypothetical protein
MFRLLRLVVLMAVMVAGVLGFYWYSYVTNTESPYQEIGIELNSRMPDPIRKWGCDKLHETFPKALPPNGCQADDGKSWM